MNCEICSDVIAPPDKAYVHKGKPHHRSCLFDLMGSCANQKTQSIPPSELELAYRRGDEISTYLRDSRHAAQKRDSGQPIHDVRAYTLSEIVLSMRTLERLGQKCGLGADVIEELLRKNSAVIKERDDALRRCGELEQALRRSQSPNAPEGAEVHES